MLSVIVKVADRSVLFYIIIKLSVIAKPPKVRVEMTNPRDVFYRKMAERGGWEHLDLADALKVMEKEKTFHIATIKWLIVLIPVLIPDCLSNIYLLEVEIYSDHWMKKTLNKYWSINRNVFDFI
jgi:hypothetical protein